MNLKVEQKRLNIIPELELPGTTGYRQNKGCGFCVITTVCIPSDSQDAGL
jgi:hypothetical protein